MNGTHQNSPGGGVAVLGCIALVALSLFISGAGVAAYILFRAPVPVAAPPVPAVSVPLSVPPVARPMDPVAPPVDPVATPVITPQPEVRGALGRDEIRAVIRAHVNEVSACYEAGLAIDPNLSGRVTVSFLIADSGVVETASVASSELSSPTDADDTTAECIVARVRTWTFPPPDGGGVVGVNYPFLLESP